MKTNILFLATAVIALTACSSSPQNSEMSSFTSSESSQSRESTSSESVPEEAPSDDLTWSSTEEAIEFYENALTKDLGEELADIKLGGEFYERDSWKLIKNSGNTIILSLKNVGLGGENAVEFKKEEEYTYITFFEVDSPYPENPISRRTVQNSDMVTINKENLKLETDSSLSAYSPAEIEYARVWLEVIGNKNIEELNVSLRLVGEPINPYEEDSAAYPEDVIVLGGKTMADGNVTYSSNGDGTINLYEVPPHWQEGTLPEGKTMAEYTSDIINNPIIVPISTGNEEDIIKLIERESIQK